jgi:metal-sulfur cluster biosynthetic enzyme
MAQLETSSDIVSDRGRSLEPKVPVFFDVLNNLWDPELNSDGIVNLGLAENVRPLHWN